MVVEKRGEQFRVNGSVKLSAQRVSFSLESNAIKSRSCRDWRHATCPCLDRWQNSPSHAREMSIRHCWKCFERTILWLYDCEDKDRFRSRDLQFETISSTIESRLVKVERKNGDYLNGGYPNGCRDRESQDRESESTLARHHWSGQRVVQLLPKTWNKASVWAYEVYLRLKSRALYRSTSWLFEIYIERVSGREGTDRGVRSGLGGRTRRDATNRDKSRRRNPLFLTRGITLVPPIVSLRPIARISLRWHC